MTVGVLALQGAFREHLRMLSEIDVQVREVRLPADFHGLRGLILPGGESTTMVHLMNEYQLWAPVRALHGRGGSLWGTCAGAILLGNGVLGGSPNLPAQPSLGLLNATLRRNAFGRQAESFDVPLEVRGLDTPFPAVFIRAPVIEQVGQEVEVLARYEEQTVLVRQGRVMASSFHPELTGDARLHQLFLNAIRE